MRHTTYNQTSGKLEDRRPGTMASTKSEGGIIAHEPLKMQLAVRMRMAMTAKASTHSKRTILKRLVGHTNRLRNDSATILNNAGQAVKTSCRNSLNLDNTKV